jgi:hypothetical protein
MKTLAILLILILVAGITLIFLQSKDIISLINKPDAERRKEINTILEYRLNELQNEYFNFESKIINFPEKDRQEYQKMNETIERLNNILNEMQDKVTDEVQWRLLQKRFKDRFTTIQSIINGWKYRK